ncbi:hypothetical protein SAMN05660649_02797 [Desulfotomaculum arcticum]|uniref:Uncharacterized protein n=1 Tax=Desulfotruncus arcticus DSM 17038 TaxID=1121424 RepID=A0A1I2V0P5_9FIRM|nr:hypothetical protein [Desulfotruncus arcticus]SFG82009.1 hypothetical protein SAMN05660649_02797 [Desulfotomaculum arcticum] [Desulfotruncus arcticus DSM 17038]
MRRIMCVSCGKSITVDSCTGLSCRDMSCPDCGGRMVRDHSVGALNATGNQGIAGGKQNNTFIFGSGMGNMGRGMNGGRGMNKVRGMNQGRGRQNCGRSI